MKTRLWVAAVLLPALFAWAMTALADAGGNPSARLKVDDAKVIFCEAL